jgi:hypothetical protein
VLDCASFDDTIGVNGWPLELHLKGDVEFRWPKIPESRGFNHLPYRMTVPQGLDNVWVAGRCASMSHEAQSAARVTGACFVMGEAVGIAATWRWARSRPRHRRPALQARSSGRQRRLPRPQLVKEPHERTPFPPRRCASSCTAT